ncbi:hypothetical protein ACLB2K_058987 [Fragaria x ananassa]
MRLVLWEEKRIACEAFRNYRYDDDDDDDDDDDEMREANPDTFHQLIQIILSIKREANFLANVSWMFSQVRGAEVNSEQRVGGCCGRVTSRTRKKLVCGLDFLIRRKGFPGATSGDEFTSTRRSILTAEREQSNYREPGRSGGSEGRAPGSVGGSTGSKDPKNELL